MKTSEMKKPSLEEWVSTGMGSNLTALLERVQQNEAVIDAHINKPEVWVYVPKEKK